MGDHLFQVLVPLSLRSKACPLHPHPQCIRSYLAGCHDSLEPFLLRFCYLWLNCFFFTDCSIVCSPAHKIFPAMIEPFSGVKFYIIPSAASRLKENNQRMISILRTGMALQETTINDNVTHVICNSSDFVLAQKTTSDSVFCCYVTPKWVFISQSLRYCLPVVCIQCWFE